MNKYSLEVTNKFKKDFKLCIKRGLPIIKLVWEQNDTTVTLLMLRTGSHSDLF